MKKSLITGFIILLPLILSILLFVFLVDLLTDPLLKILQPFLQTRGFESSTAAIIITRAVILIMLIIATILLGMIASWFFVKPILSYFTKTLFRIPVVRTIYRIAKEVITALVPGKEKKVTIAPVIIPFPKGTNYAMAFSPGAAPKECLEKTKKDLVAVFMPSALHPISGYFLLMPKSNVHSVNMTNEEAIKFIVSCGVVVPRKKKKTGP